MYDFREGDRWPLLYDRHTTSVLRIPSVLIRLLPGLIRQLSNTFMVSIKAFNNLTTNTTNTCTMTECRSKLPVFVGVCTTFSEKPWFCYVNVLCGWCKTPIYMPSCSDLTDSPLLYWSNSYLDCVRVHLILLAGFIHQLSLWHNNVPWEPSRNSANDHTPYT